MEAYLEDFITKDWGRAATCRKPTIAAVAGYALGGGCEIAMMCDIILAAENARFGQPEITIGTIPGSGGTQRLIRQVGKSEAMEMCRTGRMMNAEEAERVGLVSRIVPADDLVDEAIKVADTIAKMSRPIAYMVKEAINYAYEDAPDRGHPLRAPTVPRVLWHRGPERGHGRLRREAPARLQEQVTETIEEARGWG